MTVPCILAVRKNSLIRLSLANLIGSSEGELIAVESEAQDLDELMQEVDRNKAQVLLLENSNPLAKGVVLTRLLMFHPDLSVVIIQEDTNWLSVYRKENRLFTSVTDLMDFIRSLPNTPE